MRGPIERMSRRRIRLAAGALSALLWCVALPADGTAQEKAPSAPSSPETKRFEAVRRQGALSLDGRLDDPAWEQASFRSDFLQKGKDRGFEPRAETSVAMVYDDEALYVAARMERDGQAAGALGQRDDAGNVDRILVSLDTFRDLRSAFTFGVTVSGVRIDYVSSRDNESWIDHSFDPLWEARVAMEEDGWTAEMRIPFSQLRFSGGASQVWGVNIRRWNPATYLNVYWVVVPYYESGWTSRFGELHGLETIKGGAGLELTPYALVQATTASASVADVRSGNARYGGDVKLGLGSSLTLDATVRPDFGQVEADPARVNLSAFETFFPERRPFFTEGTELFRVRGPNYFYSRRIGSTPVGATPRESFERVESAAFLGGAKLTGRLPSGTSIGALAALTDQERAPLAQSGDPAIVAPRTVFAVARAQQEVGSAGSNIGLLVTGVERFFASGSPLLGAIPGRAAAGGLDWTFRFGGGNYEVAGFAGQSWVSGSPEALHGVQTSSAHYFQRPDASHVGVNPWATELFGWAAGTSLEKRGGTHWLWSVGGEAFSPGFEIRDAGSQRRADRLETQASLTWRARDGAGLVRDRTFGAWTATGWNFGGVRRHTAVAASGALTWQNLWTTTLEGGLRLPALSDDLTRGGPLMGTPRAGWVDAGLYSSPAAQASWSLLISSLFDEFGSTGISLDGGVRLQATDRLELDLRAGVSEAEDARQFVAAIEGGSPETYGTRWIFARLNRREVYLRLRAKMAFAPDAVLTLYAEPFLASGSFRDFGELTAAGASTLRNYGSGGTRIEWSPYGYWTVNDGTAEFYIGNYDYWLRSFRSNSVFRWEWRRGSTLFLIWQRSLWSWDDEFRTIGPPELLDSLNDPGENVFLAKISVLLGLD